MNNTKLKIGITHGDINGIGYEIILKTLADNGIYDMCVPIVYGSSKIAAYYRKNIGMDNFSFNLIKYPVEANPKRANLINVLNDEFKAEPGAATLMSGKAAFISLERATDDLKKGLIDAIVTAPIHKQAIQSNQFQFPGHTEYLQSKFGNNDVLMFLISENLKVGTLTGHIPINEISQYIKKDLILKKIRLIHQSLEKDFGINRPKIAVLGLNPHASDNGLIGKEEQNEIIPAIKQARDEKIMAMGPYPADGFFASLTYKKFDAILAMYHDQGLSPFKILAFEDGVNYTAGLPIVRTSPDHGTAFDIADKNMANPSSFRHALFAAIDIWNKRAEYNEITKNPVASLKRETTNE
ncbi:MAG TPA: 4-hydroxythreonine-4-phosphate dehydrogenase PdxA [Bacteroidales bacterium]|nr:4-hydroxythreonine-4-phosphate dehydrogenase PdxA [Bacteroidales bacterium]